MEGGSFLGVSRGCPPLKDIVDRLEVSYHKSYSSVSDLFCIEDVHDRLGAHTQCNTRQCHSCLRSEIREIGSSQSTRLQYFVRISNLVSYLFIQGSKFVPPLERQQEWNVNMFFVIGGNGSHAGATAIYEQVKT